MEMKRPDEIFELLTSANPVPDPRAGGEAAPVDEPVTFPESPDRRPAPRRARWWLNPGIAVAALAAVVVGFTLFLAGRGPAPDEAPAVSPTTTVPDESPTTTAPPAPAGLGYVVATADGVDLVDGRGTIGRLVQGGAVVALDDGGGGIVYQRTLAGGEEEYASEIVHLRAGGEPVVLVSDIPGDTISRLWDVVEIDGRATVVVIERRNPGDLAEATEHLMEYDLASGAVSEIAYVEGTGSESGVEAVSWDGSRYVVEVLGSGYVTFSTIDRDGVIRPWSGDLPAECGTFERCPRLRVATPDGRRLVLLDGSDVVVWDRASDAAETILQGEGGDEVRGFRIDGPVLVVNRYDGDASVYDLTGMKLDPVRVAGFADPVLDMPSFPGNVSPAEPGPGLTINGVERESEACAGVDGAVVYRPIVEGELTVIVGFEEGVFVRVLGEGVEVETSDVVLEERSDGSSPATATLDVDGETLTIEAVVVDGLPDCTP